MASMPEDVSPPLHPRHGIHAPTWSSPSRVPRSLRRTATTDMLRPDGIGGDLVLVGRARDLLTDARGNAHVLGRAGYVARIAYLGPAKSHASRPSRAIRRRSS